MKIFDINEMINESFFMSPLQRAQKDGYVNITGPEGKRKIKYITLEREQNILADLPRAYGKPQEFRFYKGTENDIKPVAREEICYWVTFTLE